MIQPKSLFVQATDIIAERDARIVKLERELQEERERADRLEAEVESLKDEPRGFPAPGCIYS